MNLRLCLEVLGFSTIRPWMEAWERDLIKDVLLKLRPTQCLEWGCGFSTIYFTRFLQNGAYWRSIEHEQEWAENIQQQAALLCRFGRRGKIDVYHVEPNHHPWAGEFDDGTEADFANYISFPDQFKPFDFILVDGRARKDCIKKACELIADKGVLILHDANRKYYREYFGLYEHQLLFTDARNDAGGVWIGSNGIDIHAMLDGEQGRDYYKYLNNKAD